ncbi:SAM-dependent methyltransferase [Paenibacillus sp. PastF-1]|nr:SAM-dependent methyltransferase [Paenibacillus sp. PastF-2]MDF9846020.1 SAM-dependent methyltransferase [Paenibacillus sp. PastM-2]MDF9852593.1 SAM-dependent methyltransferase [Paenibacillus sp. PastF-1]MDH6477676.1 SAM-dependent methyltransferase [Paenibacillus sp. PastH-2]MDH6505416.1 SAM-dependent methyltransferase [Paenibacillus sp. PastM-3]
MACGLPEDYFDIIYSVYAIGWTTDLEGAFARIASYLNKDGVFIACFLRTKKPVIIMIAGFQVQMESKPALVQFPSFW